MNCSGASLDSTSCNADPCPVNGNWVEWSLWNECSLTCGNGTTWRYRSCNNPAPSFGGRNCSGVSLDTTSCKTEPCPVNGNWEVWSVWSNCSESCGSGIQNRSRDCNNPFPTDGGIFCLGLPLELQVCNNRNCPDAEATFEVSGQNSDTVLAGVAVGCVVVTTFFIFIIQFIVGCIYKGKKDTIEQHIKLEDSFDDLRRKRILEIHENESVDSLNNVTSGAYDTCAENPYEKQRY